MQIPHALHMSENRTKDRKATEPKTKAWAQKEVKKQ